MVTMSNRTKLNEEFHDWIFGDAIFTALQSFDVPWKNEDIASELDYEYFGNVSGEKYISPLVRKLAERDDLSESDRHSLLASVIYQTYKKSWEKEYATFVITYDPIKNYDVTETMTDDETVDLYGHTQTRTDNLSHTKTGTESQTPNLTETRTDNLSHAKTGTETQTPDITETRTDDLTHAKTGTETTVTDSDETRTPQLTTSTDVYGFNSESAVHAGLQGTTGTETDDKDITETLTHNTEEEDTGTQTTTRKGTDELEYNVTERSTGTQQTSTTGTDTTTYNTTDSNTGTSGVIEGGSDSHTRNYVLEKKGNIGLTPFQTLIKDERELWLWNFFQNIVFPDIDKVLTIPIY